MRARRDGHDVIWASAGRSEATATARTAGVPRRRPVAALVRGGGGGPLDLPAARRARRRARVAGYDGVYVDANAISPTRAAEVAEVPPRFVDGGIVGGPPHRARDDALYLSGERAAGVAALFAGSPLEARVVADASALKMTYAAWSKGTAALLLAIRDVAARYGVEDASLRACRELGRARALACRSGRREEGWRWVGEMEEIADTFAAAGQPEGFHRAAAEVVPRVITAHGLAKRYGDRRVFAGVDVELRTAASCS